MSLRAVEKFFTWNPRISRFEAVKWRRDVLPSWLTFARTDTALPFTVAAAGAPTPPVAIVQPYTSVNGLDRGLGTPFEVRSLVFQDSTDGTLAANFTVLMKEVGEVRQFMNREVHVRTLFGTGGQPALLREPYMMMSQHNVSFQMAKIAGGATTTRMYFAGAQYFPWSPELMTDPAGKAEIVSILRKWQERRKYVTPYWLTTDLPVNLTANQTANFTAKIGDDGHFEAFGHAKVATGAFQIQISEVKTKQTLMNGTVTDVNGAGDARFPTIYPTPYLLPAGSRLQVQITDLSGAPNRVDWTWFGRKIYAPISQTEEILKDTSVPTVPTPADTPTLFVPAPF